MRLHDDRGEESGLSPEAGPGPMDQTRSAEAGAPASRGKRAVLSSLVVGAAVVVGDAQQFLEQAGRVHGQGGHGGEEVEELFVARQESQCNVRVTGGGEDNSIFGRRPEVTLRS